VLHLLLNFSGCAFLQTLSVEEVRARYAARLPDSPPAVLNHTVRHCAVAGNALIVYDGVCDWISLRVQATIQENGEVGDHALVPEFYLSGPIPPAGTNLRALIASISLLISRHACAQSCQFCTCRRRRTLRATHTTLPPQVRAHSNFHHFILEYHPDRARCESEHRPRLYISAFPANAELFLLDGTPLLPPATGAAPTFIAYDTFKRSYPVRIRPPLDQFSARYGHHLPSGHVCGCQVTLCCVSASVPARPCAVSRSARRMV
jgi:hypothetical protein